MLLAERSGDVQALGAGPTSHQPRVYTQLCSASAANATHQPSGTLSTEQASVYTQSVHLYSPMYTHALNLASNTQDQENYTNVKLIWPSRSTLDQS